MSVRVMTQVWDADISTAEKMVLLIIADHANDDGTNAWPSVATIARKASISERSVQRHIKSLESAGLLRVEQQAGGNAKMRNDRRPNRYDVIISALHGVTTRTVDDDGVTDETSRGDKQSATGCQMEHDGVTPVSPNPSIQPSIEPSSNSLHHPQMLDVPSIEPATEKDADGFDEFWAVYPRKVQKRSAALRWKNMTQRDRTAALAGIREHVEFWKREGREERFIPHPATWLHGRRWEDALESDWTPDPQPNLSKAGQSIREMIKNANSGRTTDRGLPRGTISGMD